MTDETLQRAVGIRHEIDHVTSFINSIDKGREVEIRFANGGYCGCSIQSELLNEAEVEEFKNNLNSLIRSRAEARLAELQEEYNNL